MFKTIALRTNTIRYLRSLYPDDEQYINMLIRHILNIPQHSEEAIRHLEELGVYVTTLVCTDYFSGDFCDADQEAEDVAKFLKKKFKRDLDKCPENKISHILKHLMHNIGHIGFRSTMVIAIRIKNINDRKLLEIIAWDNGSGFTHSLEWSIQRGNTTQPRLSLFIEGFAFGGKGLYYLLNRYFISEKDKLTLETLREDGTGERMVHTTKGTEFSNITEINGSTQKGSRIQIEISL